MPDPRRLRIKQIIQDAKTKCVKCSCKDKRKLTFHHRDGETKEFDIADGPRKTIGAVKRELKKCDVMCRDCHDILHDMVPKKKKPNIKPKIKKRPSGAQRRKRKKINNASTR